MGRKFANSGSINLDDVNESKDWIIYSSILSFDTDKGAKFSTWLANQVKYFCLNLKNKTSKYVQTESDTIEYLINNFYNSSDSNSNKKEVINTINDLLEQIKDENIKNAIYYRYFSNKEKVLNYSEVGEILNVTPQTVLNWHNKFIDLAKKKLTSNSNNDII
jgi:DNA-directed RNA polymerase specialized sigma subunit